MLISSEDGISNAYGLFYLQERGQMFVAPNVKNYSGMIVGIHARDNDLVVNANKVKKLTNIRTTAADEKLVLAPPRQLTLEYALEFINDDELVEVTPLVDPAAQDDPRSQSAPALREEARRHRRLADSGPGSTSRIAAGGTHALTRPHDRRTSNRWDPALYE